MGSPIKLKDLIPVENDLRAPFPLGKLSAGPILERRKMAVIRPEWGTDRGPDEYTPPDRRAKEDSANQSASAVLRQRSPEQSHSPSSATTNLDAFIRRVCGASIDEIDGAIRELENMRETLRVEGERVSREIGGFASLNQASMFAMKIISDNIDGWKNGPR
jgi:hypothetical protein